MNLVCSSTKNVQQFHLIQLFQRNYFFLPVKWNMYFYANDCIKLSITITIADIARKLKTTSATVPALNDHPAINAKKKTILRTAEEDELPPPTTASSLQLGQTGVGVIIPSAGLTFGSVVHGIEVS